MKTARFTFIAAGIFLLTFFCSVARAQSLHAWSTGADNYNMPGSTGVPFFINSYGHWECSGSGHSMVFVSRKCNFSIPAGATILGIDVSCDVIISNLIDSSIVLLKGGVPYGTDGAHRLPILFAPDIHWGGDTSLWGGTWTPADLNDTNFGFRFSVKEISSKDKFGWIDANGLYVRVSYQLSSGIRESQTTLVNVYPNPAAGVVRMDFDKELKDARLRILNTAGREVINMGVVSGNAATADLSMQPAGVYFLEVADKGNVAHTRLVKN